MLSCHVWVLAQHSHSHRNNKTFIIFFTYTGEVYRVQ